MPIGRVLITAWGRKATGQAFTQRRMNPQNDNLKYCHCFFDTLSSLYQRELFIV